jgi:hypothetical protein
VVTRLGVEGGCFFFWVVGFSFSGLWGYPFWGRVGKGLQVAGEGEDNAGGNSAEELPVGSQRTGGASRFLQAPQSPHGVVGDG